MEYGFGTEVYYKKMLDLQEKLRRSEEGRLRLEEKFNEMIRLSRDAEHDRLRHLRHKYHRFLEEDKIRQERNENILRALDRIGSRARSLAAKTDRFKAFRKQYENHLKRIYLTSPDPPKISNYPPKLSHSPVRKKLFSEIPATESAEAKLAMLEQYLRDNFQNFPEDLTPTFQTPADESRPLGAQTKPERHEKLSFYDERSEMFDSDSKDSQVPSQHEPNLDNLGLETGSGASGSQLLGSRIEKELDRLRGKIQGEKVPTKMKDPVAKENQEDHYIKNYKDLVLKSEEKFGLKINPLISPKKVLDVKVEDELQQNDTEQKITKIFESGSKTVNVHELNKVTEEQPKIGPDSTQLRQENPVITKYKQLAKTLKEEDLPFGPAGENAVPSEDKIPLAEREVKKVDEEEVVPPEDSSERTEPPTDVSLSASSLGQQIPSEESPSGETVQSVSTKKLREVQQDNVNLRQKENVQEFPEDLVQELNYKDHEEYKKQEDTIKSLRQKRVRADQKNLDGSNETSNIHQDESDKNAYQEGSKRNDSQRQENDSQRPYGEAYRDQNFPSEQQQGYEDHQMNLNHLEDVDHQGVGKYQNSVQLQQMEQHQLAEGQRPERPQNLDGFQHPDQLSRNEQYQRVEDQYQSSEAYQHPEQFQSPESYQNPDQFQSSEQYENSNQYQNGQNQDQFQSEQYIEGNYQQEGYAPENYTEGFHAGPQETYDSQHYQEDPSRYLTDPQYPKDSQYQKDPSHYPADPQYTTDQQFPADPQFSDQQFPTGPQNPADEQYSTDHQFPPDQQYPTDQEQYSTDQLYPTGQEQYATDQQYPPGQDQYPSDQQYPTDHQHPTDQQFPADQQQYPEGYDQNFHPQEYPEGHPVEYNPENYPADYSEGAGAEYDPQQYPDPSAVPYNADIYHSGQEYLQGEQNVDLQYQSEENNYGNPENQQQEYEAYTNQEYQQNQQYPTSEQSKTPQPEQNSEKLEPEKQQQEEQQPTSPQPKSPQVKESQEHQPKDSGAEVQNQEQGKSSPVSENTEKSPSSAVKEGNKPLVEKKMPNLAEMLDTDTESIKQDTKVSNDSDFDFSNA